MLRRLYICSECDETLCKDCINEENLCQNCEDKRKEQENEEDEEESTEPKTLPAVQSNSMGQTRISA